MRKSILIIGFLALCGGAFAQTPAKKRIAIMNFDYATVVADVTAVFGSQQDVGKGIADLLVDKLVNGGAYSVIERKALDKLMAEQNFSNSDRADPNSAAKLGKLLGVDTIVIGSITQFGRDDKTTKVGGGGFGNFGARYGVGGVSQKNSKAVVGITARMVNVETGEILVSQQAHGESSRSGTSLIGGGGGYGGGGGGGFSMSGSNFASTIIGEAVNQAVADLATKLDSQSASIPTHVIEVSGVVADVTGNTVILNVGTKAGVAVGQTLAVKRPTREIKDPITGKVLRRIEDSIGTVTITEAEADSAVGNLSAGAAAKVGDTVKSQ
jgi:curli biogenesis system outer membrane secretion channel CsgG